MKSASLLILRILLATSFTVGLLIPPLVKPQEQKELPRVGLELRCPEYTIACCEPLTLRADVFGTNEALWDSQSHPLAYHWEVSGGKVLSGEGSSEVTVAPKIASKSIQAVCVTLKLNGGPPYLEKEKVCKISVNPQCVAPIKLDAFIALSKSEQRIRLDRLATHMTADKSSVAFLVAYAGRNSCFWEAESWAESAKRFLINNYKIQPSRVMAIDGGFRDISTMEIFISSNPSCGPFPKPTLVGSKASVIEPCNDKYRETAWP